MVTGVTAIGWRAHAALTATGGRAKVVAPLSSSLYAEAAGELIWVGPPRGPLHPRSVLAAAVPAAPHGDIVVAVGPAPPWRPQPPRMPDGAARDAVRSLRLALASLGPARGLLGAGAVGATDAALARAHPLIRAVGDALSADRADAFADAARQLLGLGEGLTPSGDDFIGGVLFARRSVARAHDAAWAHAIERLVGDAPALTHPVSACLLRDLAAGEGWAALHDLADALARGDAAAAGTALRGLTALGQSSGWDLLGGYVSGLEGLAARVRMMDA